MLAETPLLETTLERELATLAVGRRYGKVVEVVGTMLKVAGVQVSLGEVCELRQRDGTLLQRAEVVGFSRDLALLAPFGELIGLSRETRVIGLGRPLAVPVGPALLGRVLDGLGEPSDGQGAIACDTWVPIQAQAPDPMRRRLIEHPMPTGVRIVDGLMTLGEGQRMGIFAAAGVGKSTLMGMFARGTQCDVNVIVLIGERGREVREFIELILGADGLARSVVVCATSDRSSIERAKAAYVGTAIAEYFRDRGLRVLLMMDSLTRFARAQREIGLAAGEPPTRRGFPPSVFAELPRLLERAGMGERVDHRVLHRAGRGRYRQRSDCRGSARHPRWAPDSLSRDRGQEPVPGNRRAGQPEPGDEPDRPVRPLPGRWPVAAPARQVQRGGNPGAGGRIPSGKRCRCRRSDRQDRCDPRLSQPTDRPAQCLRKYAGTADQRDRRCVSLPTPGRCCTSSRHAAASACRNA